MIKNNTVIKSYLKKLNEAYDGSEIILQTTIQLFIWLFMYVLIMVSISKTDKSLSEKINKITGKYYNIRIIDSDVPSAFCFGGFTNPIFITKGLMKLMNERELISICLHEVSHITTYDSLQSFVVQYSSISIGQEIALGFVNFLSKNKNTNIISVAILVGLLTILISTIPTLLLGKYHDLKSDKYVIQYGYGKDLISALQKIEKWVLENKVKDSKIKMFFHKIQHYYDVHPTVKTRVDKLLKNIELYEAMIKNNKSKIKNIIYKTIGENQ